MDVVFSTVDGMDSAAPMHCFANYVAIEIDFPTGMDEGRSLLG